MTVYFIFQYCVFYTIMHYYHVVVLLEVLKKVFYNINPFVSHLYKSYITDKNNVFYKCFIDNYVIIKLKEIYIFTFDLTTQIMLAVIF